MTLSYSRLSFLNFSSSSLIIVIILIVSRLKIAHTFVSNHWLVLSFFLSLLVQVVIYFILSSSGYVYQVAWRASLLGLFFGTGLIGTILAPLFWKPFAIFIVILSFFHFSEYFCLSIIKPKTLSLDSFLLNHSLLYKVTFALGITEYLIEVYLCPRLKTKYWISILGLIICVFGEVVRKLAMLTAKSNFDHHIQTTKQEGHVLITHGIYALSRHPGYMGWFYWAIGSQITLINIVCIPVYAYLAWTFFNSRITTEEITLLNFFGQDYVNYQKKVGIGIPFIKGYRID